ncbi:MAG: CDGSH iron-sulfur domain-containing protein [Odoribacter sp.]|nr:CDGSH iron-sulfur domain-containing protein [Odoribacter sp.]
MEQEQRLKEPATPQPDKRYHIEIVPHGPYLVYGNPPIQQEILIQNEEGIPWEYDQGHCYSSTNNPTVLCRCGRSGRHPYCDGSHTRAEWDSRLTADTCPLLEKATLYDGPAVELSDNPDYCARVRICMARHTAWKNTLRSNNPEAKENAIHETVSCPSGRLKIRDKATGNYIEPPFQPEIGLIEDPQKKCSGPLWVKGGIPINSADTAYEQRNRITLCRCGASVNKPFCDGSHIEIGFNDHLPLDTEKETE